MRVISGSSRGRRLAAEHGRALRPTSDRIRTPIFDILGGEVKESAVLDLFAGTGSLGIEALSRGATKALFVENRGEALQVLRKNLSQCGMEAESEIFSGDVLRAIGVLQSRRESFDLIFMDPPYGKGLIAETIRKLGAHRIYHGRSLLVIQHDRREPLPEPLRGWRPIRERRIGDTIVSFLRPENGPEGEETAERR
jgi:16S rRNA (guanine966-N2)-methyltransferase